MQDSYLTYAMSTIMDRALPDVRDGLKPSQRRILVAMNDLNLGPRGPSTASAPRSPATPRGNYHPHGEAVDLPHAGPPGPGLEHALPAGRPRRATSAPSTATRRRPCGTPRPAWPRPPMEMLDDLKLDTVDFQPNYDETREEPIVLPSKFPNLLVNGSTGIAVGMATSIPPHNLREICDAIVACHRQPGHHASTS